MPIDAKLYDYATPRQREFLDAIEQYGSATAANKALGLSTDIVAKSMRRLRAHAAKQGYAPGHFEHGVAPGYAMGKVTEQPDHAAAFAEVLRRYAGLIEGGKSAEDAARELLPIVRIAARYV